MVMVTKIDYSGYRKLITVLLEVQWNKNILSRLSLYSTVGNIDYMKLKHVSLATGPKDKIRTAM